MCPAGKEGDGAGLPLMPAMCIENQCAAVVAWQPTGATCVAQNRCAAVCPSHQCVLASCSETATNSVAADKAACEAVTSLGSASACNQVMKAEPNIAASCRETATGDNSVQTDLTNCEAVTASSLDDATACNMIMTHAAPNAKACTYSAASYIGACSHVPESAGKRNQCESVDSFGSNCQFKAAEDSGTAAACTVATGVAATCTAADDAISTPDTCPTSDCIFTAATDSIARTACVATDSSGKACVYEAATSDAAASCTMDQSVMCETDPDAADRDVAKCPEHSCTFTATTASCSECAAGKYTGEMGLAECADCEVRRLLFAIFHQYHALPSSHHYVRAAK